jgi:ribonuclease HI
MITIFMDGSSVKQNPKAREYVLSWGIVAHHGDQTIEKFGNHSAVHQSFNGFHEIVAFIESMRYAKNQGFTFEDMSFYTDDISLPYAGFMLHPSNFVATEDVDRFKQRLSRMCAQYYDDATLSDVLECLTKSRFTHVKGHDVTVYNLRADYLARHAHQLALGTADPFIAFDPWIEAGILKYASVDHPYKWYPHFAYTADGESDTSVTLARGVLD